MTQDRFGSAVAFSLGLHGFLLCALLVRAFFLPSQPLEIRSAIRVDIVGLPDKITSPPPTATSHPASEPAKPEESPVAPNPAVAKPKLNTNDIAKKAIERMKAMESIEKMQRETEQQKALQAAAVAKAKAPTYKGNVLSSGDSLTGLDKVQYDEYFTILKNALQRNFHIPQWLAESNLRAQAVAMVDERGYVIQRQITQSSGNELFDGMVLEAIDKSSPLPPPPSALANIIKFRGVTFNFPK